MGLSRFRGKVRARDQGIWSDDIFLPFYAILWFGAHGGPRSLAIESWYLIEYACLSLTSAVSRDDALRLVCWRLTAVAMISSKAAFMLPRASSFE
jgi:hypothetical protein